MYANQVNVNLGALTLGSGTVYFTEQIIALDSNGNELPGVIGSISHVFTSNSSPVWSGQINFSQTVTNFRAKKSFTLVAPDLTPGVVNDLAAVAIVNQNIQVVPEPATMTALGLGIAAMLRKRRK